MARGRVGPLTMKARVSEEKVDVIMVWLILIVMSVATAALVTLAFLSAGD